MAASTTDEDPQSLDEKHAAQDPSNPATSTTTLKGDKEKLAGGHDWMEIKMEDATSDSTEAAESQQIRGPRQNGDGQERHSHDTPQAPAPKVPTPQPNRESHSTPADVSNGADPRLGPTPPERRGSRQFSESSTTAAGGSSSPHPDVTVKLDPAALPPQRPLSSSSMIFVVNALQTIAASKEARKKKQLGDAVQRALAAIKELDPELPDPELIFEPLQLATVANSVPLASVALDCIGKLISHSYFSTPSAASRPPTASDTPPPPPLIERAIDTIIDCFQGEATPVETQLQIVKSLLGAVLNDKIVVHGAGLLKAIRQTYNIFLLSKSSANQQIAQGTLTQMVGTVFERVKSRLAMKEARTNLSKLSVERSSEAEIPPTNDDVTADVEAALSRPPATTVDGPALAESKEPITLQSFENRKSFDDDRIQDNAPTMVTRVRETSSRTLTGTPVPSSVGDENEENEEEEEDEIYMKDAFLVFRAMCKLSIKSLPTEQLLDLKSHGMRSKLLSLHLVHTILNNHIAIFVSPLATIKSSTTSQPTSFVHAIKQYLCLSLSRNGASSVNRVFEVSCEIFWLMLQNMREPLKKEIEVFLKEIYLAILDKRNAPLTQKQYLMGILQRLCADPRALVELYLNYDCDGSALDNMFQRVIEHLSRISSTPVLITPSQQFQYQEQHARAVSSATEWQSRGTLPPSLSTANVTSAPENESAVPLEYSLKRESLECLVETLRSLVNWSQQGIADATARLQESESRDSLDAGRESMETPGTMTNGATPKVSNAEAVGIPSTPSLHAVDDPDELEKAKHRKIALIKGVKQFNFKAKRGIKVLIADGFVASDSPQDVARFLLHTDGLDKAAVGEYLGEGEPRNVAIMHAFVDLMDFTKTRFVDALRQFLQGFRLPGEAQKIDRFMLKFAERYISGNPNAFANADTAYVLAYSVIMLNTDQHSTKLKGPRMTKGDFVKNNRGINDNADLPEEYLGGIYDEINQNEIVLHTERDAAAAMGVVPPPTGGIASNIGQALATVGRDLQREAYAQASDEMANKTEQQFRNLVRAQRKNATKAGSVRFIAATSFKHVGPMFDVSWMSLFSGLSGQIQDTQNLETIRLCTEGFKLAIRIACLFDLETAREAFVSALAKFTSLNNLSEMAVKHVEALKALLEVAQSEGNLLKGSWRDVLMCISQLDRFQLISTGVDEGAVPDVSKARIVSSRSDGAGAGPSQRSASGARRPRPRVGTTSSGYLPDVALEIRSTDFIKGVDRIFTNTAHLSGDGIVHFVRALSEVSWQEIQSSGQSESPRTFSLQKLVEISYYNMTRVRFEWTALWQILGEHFNQVGCHPNTSIVFIALDSLRQLSMRFLEIEELPGFKFQKDFLKPFEHVMSNSGVVSVKHLVLDCLIQMIQARGDNIRSGWRTMFGVFTVAAQEPYEAIVTVAFDHVSLIYQHRFGVVVSQGAFADLAVCLTEFSKNSKFQKKSLQAIETLKSTIPKMLRTPECPLSTDATGAGSTATTGLGTPSSRALQEEQFWFPILFAFHNVLMTGDDLEVRSRALGYLFDALIKYGGSFSPEFWDILWRQLLYPIFMVLKSKSEMSKVLNHEELSVWLSTTMIQALRNMIALFTHYFAALEYMLDRFLELLTLCICQENDTIARIGSNCLQQLILQNVNKFEREHWTKIVGAFVELFDRTTAHQLFSAATANSHSRHVSVTTKTPTSTVESSMSDLELNTTPVEERATTSPVDNSLQINGLPPANASVVVYDENDAGPGPTENQGRPPRSNTAGAAELEDYRPQSGLQQAPVVVTAARRRFFNKIITRCVLQLLMIETVNELFSNDAVYARIPSPELLRVMALLKKSFLFARKFNADKDLRMSLWREGFMKQPPNLLKQESGSAATYVAILLRMYHDDGEERKRNRAETEAALIPLCVDIIHGYTILDEETQQRNIMAWRPVVVDVMEGYVHFPEASFAKHIETFYPLAAELLGRDLGAEVRLALQAMLRRIGQVRMGMPPSADPLPSPRRGSRSPSVRRTSASAASVSPRSRRASRGK
ncbi:MAG: guanine nucleotide exchange protein for ADP-robosylation factor [Thelocarpon superellum]|nr:MAG: guanine nucleotide exchange protein for ADP-robosylation factor [Thelocarpon superellum]